MASAPTGPWGPGKVGLGNLGNTCFLNSGLQCLMHTTSLMEFFLNPDWKRNLNNGEGEEQKICREVVEEFAKIAEEIWNPQSEVVVPSDLKKAIAKFDSKFDNDDQHDSHELMMTILNAIHKGLNRGKKKSPWERLYGNGANDVIVAETEWNRHKEENDSVIADLFHGQLRSILRCPDCKKRTTLFDPYVCVSLPLDDQLDNCFEKFSKEETLDENNKWICPNCQKHVLAKEKMELWTVPDIMMIHLKRFDRSGDGTTKKLNTPVSYPPEINMSKYIARPHDGHQMYKLYAVSEHTGSANSGHYITHAVVQDKQGGEEWYKFNDRSCSKASAREAHNDNAYVLLYVREGSKYSDMRTWSDAPPEPVSPVRPPSPSNMVQPVDQSSNQNDAPTLGEDTENGNVGASEEEPPETQEAKSVEPPEPIHSSSQPENHTDQLPAAHPATLETNSTTTPLLNTGTTPAPASEPHDGLNSPETRKANRNITRETKSLMVPHSADILGSSQPENHTNQLPAAHPAALETNDGLNSPETRKANRNITREAKSLMVPHSADILGSSQPTNSTTVPLLNTGTTNENPEPIPPNSYSIWELIKSYPRQAVDSPWFYRCIFLLAVVPCLISSLFAVTGILDGTYKNASWARFFDVFAFCIFAAEFVICLIVFRTTEQAGMTRESEIDITDFPKSEATRKTLITKFTLIIQAILLLVTMVGWIPFWGGARYRNFAFLGVFRIQDWFKMFNVEKQFYIPQVIYRSLYLTVLYILPVVVMIIIFALIGHYFFGRNIYGTYFEGIGSSIMMMFVYATNGKWVDVQEQLTSHGFSGSVVFSIIFLVLGLGLFANSFIALVGDSAVAESKPKKEEEQENQYLRIPDAFLETLDRERARDVLENKEWRDALTTLVEEYKEQAAMIDSLYQQFHLRVLLASDHVPVSTKIIERRTKPKV